MLLMVVDAFICGELQTVMGGNGVVVGCVTEAMTVERVEDFHKRYRGKITSIGSDNG